MKFYRPKSALSRRLRPAARKMTLLARRRDQSAGDGHTMAAT
jgi:hypothetical protein